jgi:hypothetical protein
MLAGFRQYLQYHCQASKCNLHTRVIKRIEEFYKVFNVVNLVSGTVEVRGKHTRIFLDDRVMMMMFGYNALEWEGKAVNRRSLLKKILRKHRKLVRITAITAIVRMSSSIRMNVRTSSTQFHR